jgi:MarR family transcriptional regulator, lower aerobic nicotinate degradation pathway regulator
MSSTLSGMEADSADVAELTLTDALVQLSFAVQAILGRVAADHDLSIIQGRLLGILRDREPTMAALARYLNLDKSSITGLVDRAERRGLVQRSADPSDGRSVRVAVTDKGRALIDLTGAEVDREIGLLTRNLSGPERQRLCALAGRIAPRL